MPTDDRGRSRPVMTELPTAEAVRAVGHPSDDWPAEDSLLTVRDLVKHYPVTSGLLGRPVATVRAVDGVSFRVAEGHTLALVGESGSGKTTVGKAVIRLVRSGSGSIRFDGQEIAHLEGESLQRLRPQMQMVFQDAASSLNPRKRIAEIIRAPLVIHRWGTAEQRSERVRELLSLVELPERYLYDYPQALSGGQKQRVAIARALALNPRLIVLDEPTSALDVSVQAKILNLLEGIQDQLHLTYLLITHDLGVVRHVADHVAVMYLGNIVETAPTHRLFAAPAHPYTRSLLASIPVVSVEETALLPPRRPLVGEIPSPTRVPAGCPFHTRCPQRMDVCRTEPPPWVRLGPGHYVWCHLYPDSAGEVLGAVGEEEVETRGWHEGRQSPPGEPGPGPTAMTELTDEEVKWDE